MKSTNGIDPAVPDGHTRHVPGVPVLVMQDRMEALLPVYATEQAAGADVCHAGNDPVTIPPMGRVMIPTGLHFSVPSGYEIQVRPRSGLAWKNGLFILNSPGTIDSDYRGEVRILLANFSDEPFIVQPGMRIAQLVLAPVCRMEFHLTDNLDGTARDHGGFGSTGTHRMS